MLSKLDSVPACSVDGTQKIVWMFNLMAGLEQDRFGCLILEKNKLG